MDGEHGAQLPQIDARLPQHRGRAEGRVLHVQEVARAKCDEGEHGDAAKEGDHASDRGLELGLALEGEPHGLPKHVDAVEEVA